MYYHHYAIITITMFIIRNGKEHLTPHYYCQQRNLQTRYYFILKCHFFSHRIPSLLCTAGRVTLINNSYILQDSQSFLLKLDERNIRRIGRTIGEQTKVKVRQMLLQYSLPAISTKSSIAMSSMISGCINDAL